MAEPSSADELVADVVTVHTLARAHSCAPGVPRSPTRTRTLPPVPPSVVSVEVPYARPPYLVADPSPVTVWSRARAHWTRRTTKILPSLLLCSIARCLAVSSFGQSRSAAGLDAGADSSQLQ